MRARLTFLHLKTFSEPSGSNDADESDCKQADGKKRKNNRLGCFQILIERRRPLLLPRRLRSHLRSCHFFCSSNLCDVGFLKNVDACF